MKNSTPTISRLSFNIENQTNMAFLFITPFFCLSRFAFIHQFNQMHCRRKLLQCKRLRMCLNSWKVDMNRPFPKRKEKGLDNKCWGNLQVNTKGKLLKRRLTSYPIKNHVSPVTRTAGNIEAIRK